MRKIITISGKAQHGKDTTATYLKEILQEKGNRVLIIHYADYLKFMCKQYFGWNGEKDDYGRSLLQRVGTDKVRKQNPNFWVDIVANFIEIFKDDYDYFIIPDTRFPSEIRCLIDRGFPILTIQVRRKNFENSLSPEQRQHPSETALDDWLFDVTMAMDSGVDNVWEVCDDFVHFSKQL